MYAAFINYRTEKNKHWGVQRPRDFYLIDNDIDLVFNILLIHCYGLYVKRFYANRYIRQLIPNYCKFPAEASCKTNWCIYVLQAYPLSRNR